MVTEATGATGATGAAAPGRRTRGQVRVVATAAVAVAAAVVPSAAWAHVTVQPGEVEGGGFSVVTFRVPTERDDASTTKVRVLLPEEQPVGSVSTTPVPGWEVTTEDRTLDEPLDVFGEQVDTVVGEITWTATGRGVAPHQFEDFDVSLGPLPESGEMAFTAIQTYSSGEVVKWNEVAVDDSVELEHPAPVLTITPAATGTADGSDSADATSAGAGEAQAGTTAPEATGADEGNDVLPVALSGAALVVALVALGLAVRRRA